jgi:hypothetical protein
MKKIALLLLLVPLFALLMSSCVKDDETPTFDVKVTLSYPTEFSVKPSGVEVTLTNKQSGNEIKAQSNENGVAQFPKVERGLYDIKATIYFSSQDAEKVSTISKDINVGGILTDKLIDSQANATFNLNLSVSYFSSIIIKQVYYSGCLTPEGAKFLAKDSFFELYNNSEHTVYLDGLIYGEVYGNTTGTTPSFFNTDQNNVYVYNAFKIPGDGSKHPLEPGKSVVIATSAYDFTKDNTKSIDLSKAQFEFFMDKGADTKDIPNELSADMVYVHQGYPSIPNEYVINVNGPAIVIFRAKDFASLEKVKDTSKPTQTSLILKVPNSYVLDAVECLGVNTPSLKRIPATLDQSFIFNVSGTGSGKAIIRKVKETKDGRIIYLDNNDTANDFQIIDKPVLQL